MASEGPLVTIKCENLDDIKVEPPDEEPGKVIMVAPTVMNNNGDLNSGKESCFLRIKEEPVDPEEVVSLNSSHPLAVQGVLGTAAALNVERVEVDADKGITIKTEVVDNDMEDKIDVDDDFDEDDDIDDDDLSSLDEECDFDEDKDDMDFEVDSSLDTPDSASKSTSFSNEDSLADSPDSQVKAEKESFDFNGMKIETVGNYSKCPKCHKQIKSTFIIRHIKLHDMPNEKFNCPEKGCNLKVNRINNLFRHLREIHKSKRPYVCRRRECGARFAKAQQLKLHNSEHRAEKRKRADADSENRIFICEFPGCGKEYKKRHHLKEHERKHTGDMKYSCDVCNKKFYIQAHMKRHLYSHTGIKPHECRWKCGAIFASYGGRMKHERINHYEENPLKSECPICGRPFRNQQQLVKHQMTHLNPEERKDYRCSFCHIMFDTIKLRERHEERHRDGEVFACETCEKVFKNEKNLNHHIKTHHLKKESGEEGESQAKQAKPKKEPPPKHHCHICGPPKLFCLTSLRRHLARIHSTNYKCPREDCGKCFKEKFQLDAHVEIHRLRECHLCGKKFQRKQNADIHLLGVHNFTKDDLEKLGRWNPKKDTETCPEYMTRKTNSTFKKFREKMKKKPKDEPNATDDDTSSSSMHTSNPSLNPEEPQDGPKTIDFVVVDNLKQEVLDDYP